MELPQPRPLGTQDGNGKATHDFLSLCSSTSSSSHQNPLPAQGGGFLKTHDFLQPLEQNVNTTREEKKAVMNGVEEHLLPGGIGTYSISYFNQRVGNDENSNCSSHTTATGSGFTLWDESAAFKKGKTGKENIALREAAADVVGSQWVPYLEKPSQSSSNPNQHNMTTFSSFSSFSSSQNQSFMEMITSARNDQEEDGDEEEDEFVIKKEPSSYPKDSLSVKIEAKIIDRKPNTPRSKHSATEQRRRSKINDRFQKLREIIPNSDQKRDKASFLLEVIDYIQFLQEKVNKYESSYNVWNHEPSNIMQWKNSHIAEGFLAHTQGAANTGSGSGSGPASVFARKVEESGGRVCSSLPINGQNLVESYISTTTIKERGQQQAESTPHIFSLGRTRASPVPPKQHPSDLANKTNEQELTIESGTINISSVYSQRLLNTLTQALHSSGVDLSQANISVKIDLGKRASSVPPHHTKEDDDIVPAAFARAASAGGEEFRRSTKRLRTS